MTNICDLRYPEVRPVTGPLTIQFILQSFMSYGQLSLLSSLKRSKAFPRAVIIFGNKPTIHDITHCRFFFKDTYKPFE